MKRRLLIIGGLIFLCFGLQAQGLRIANTLLLDQQGDGHQLTFAQRGLGHQLDLKQIANMNLPPVGYRNGYHSMRIDQRGYGHSAILHQYGSENAIESYQNGLLNSLTIYQGNSAYGSVAATAYTNQFGYNNQLAIEQFVDGSVWHEQLGIENTAIYSIEGGMEFSVRQLGSNNSFEGGGTYGDQVFSALQRGHGNQATLGNYLATGGAGYGNVMQQGDDNSAYGSLERGMLDIQQEGDRNQSYVEIFRGSGEGMINQLGDDNQALISLAELSDMKAEIVQQGSGNSAEAIMGQSTGNISIGQNGDNNQAKVDEIYFGNSNSGIIQQGNNNSLTTYRYGSGGRLNAMQEGNDNLLGYSDDFSLINSQLTQRGNRNQIGLSLSFASGFPDNPTNQISQLGDDNVADISGLFDSRGEVLVLQEGQGNLADLLFYNDTRLEQVGNGNSILAEQFYGLGIEAYQKGDGNYSALLQIEGGTLLNSFQLGDENLIDAYQASSGFTMESQIRQEGNQNSLIGEQYAGDPLYMKVTQSGNNNHSEYEQGYLYNSSGEIVQKGDNNQALLNQTYSFDTENEIVGSILQEGDANQASIVQGDNYELAVQTSVHQLGDNNQANIRQVNAEGSYAEIKQDGYLNMARVEQLDGEQTAVVIQEGVANSLSILQENGPSTVSASQIGEGNQLLVYYIDNANERITTVATQQLGKENTAELRLNDVESLQMKQEGNNNALALQSFNGQASLLQQGNANQMNILLSGDIKSTQLGNNNNLEARQIFSDQLVSGQYGDKNSMVIGQYEPIGRMKMNLLQEGDENLIDALQDGVRGELVAEQYGNQNTASLRQEFFASNVTAHLTQKGSMNTASILQYATTGGYAKISQWGAVNEASILQEYGYNQEAAIYQWGQNNEGVIRQAANASGSLGEIWQLGNNNEAIVEQLYQPTNIQIFQYGNGQRVHIVR